VSTRQDLLQLRTFAEKEKKKLGGKRTLGFKFPSGANIRRE